MKQTTNTQVLDDNTFGDSLSCKYLVEILNKNEVSFYEKHKICAFICNATIYFKALSDISDVKIKSSTKEMWKQTFYSQIDKSYYPKKVKSFMRNIINYLKNKY